MRANPNDIGTWLVLVVDDELANREVLMETFSFFGVRSLGAATGTLAVQIAKEHQPNIVLLDIAMPRMDGYQVLRALRGEASLHDAPIIAVTAQASPEDRERIAKAGFNGYFLKPLSITNLIEDIRLILSKGEIVR